MKGVIFSLLAGIFLGLQGIVNSHTGQFVGTWKAVIINQLGGFILAGIIMLFMRNNHWTGLLQVKKLYWFSGAFAAVIVFSNITSMHRIGATLTIAILLISQLCMTFTIDSRGWFGTIRQRVSITHLLGIGLMIIGVIVLRLS
ncbi:DMT family transporter [Paenibacillus sp. WLX1005]|uniref:DMT family transporter n=1 Tax=Paenibacillus sp. WLX1005 TaxID=3243766 RepID=UPI003983F018